MTQSVRPTPRWVALAATVGLAVFPLMVIWLNVVQRAHYNAVTQPMSQLVYGHEGWLMTLNFYVTAAAVGILAVALSRLLPTARPVVILLAVTAVLFAVDGTFHTDANGAKASGYGLVHNLAGLGIFVIGVVIMFQARRPFRSHPRWKSLAGPTTYWAAAGCVGLGCLIGLGAAGAFGVGQRIAEATRISWLLLVALHAYRVAQCGDQLSADGQSSSMTTV